MKIVDIDADLILRDYSYGEDKENHIFVKRIIELDIPMFIDDVLKPLKLKYYHHKVGVAQRIVGVEQMMWGYDHYGRIPTPIRKFYEERYENIVNLLHTIPIYLRCTNPNEKRYVRRDGEEIKENDIIDLLGAYFPNLTGGSPYIELYLYEIDKETKGNDMHFKWLFTLVLLHELAHASLDIYNEERNDRKEKIHYSTLFGKWREEFMANAVALRIIKEFGDKQFYNYAKQFMLSQPSEYALGVLMEDFNVCDYESVAHGKKYGVNSELQEEWLKYVQGNPDAKGLQKWNLMLTGSHAYLYKNKFYSEEKELVEDIVSSILSDYESKKGVKMSIREFESIFPLIDNNPGKSYEPSVNVQNASSGSLQIHLLDGDLVLNDWWTNRTLHLFVDKSGCVYKDYQNW